MKNVRSAYGQFIRNWQGLSFEKKLGMFVAPSLVAAFAVVLAVGLPALLAADPGEHLEIVSLAVSNGPDATPNIDLAVRNTGNQVAVITAVAADILRATPLSECQPPPPSGLASTGAYDLPLPSPQSRLTHIAARIYREIRPNEADRFTIRVAQPSDGPAALYLLNVSLYHESNRHPIQVGRVLIGAPFPNANYWSDVGCARDNRQVLATLLKQPSERSTELAFASTPQPQNAAPGNPTVLLTRGNAATSGYWYDVWLRNFPSRSSVEVSCYDSVSPTPFYTNIIAVDTQGSGEQSVCYSGDGPDHWVVAAHTFKSNVLTWHATRPNSASAGNPAKLIFPAILLAPGFPLALTKGPATELRGPGAVYAGEAVRLLCYGWGTPVGPYNNRLWYRVTNASQPGTVSHPNSGWLNSHYVGDGLPLNVISPLLRHC